jgi:formate dehydrogenase maturation protein FdhE
VVKELYPLITKDEAIRRIRQGLPVIDYTKLRFDEVEFNNLLERIQHILTKNAANKDLLVNRLSKAKKTGEVIPTDLVQTAITHNGKYLEHICKKAVGDKEEAVFVAIALVAPFLRVCARYLRGKIDLDQVLTDRCPICGSTPLMARLRREDGKRMLECSLCNTQWVFSRLRCPSCGNEDTDTLGFFFVKEATYRVDKCDKCKRYIKTVDERKKSESGTRALLIEDVATLYLDILAAKEGYQSISEYKN